MGVYALVGGFVASKTKNYKHKWAIVVSFILLALSIICGIGAYGSLIFDLSMKIFRVTGPIQGMAIGQWIFFFLGAPFLIVFLIKNIN
jgi:hypothetical protein